MNNKRKYIFLLLLFLIFSPILRGKYTRFYTHDQTNNTIITPHTSLFESPVFEWNRTWGGTLADYSQGVAVDSLDNVYIGGSTGSFGAGARDMVLVKYNSAGIQQWNQTWGGIDFDDCYGVSVDSLNNVYMAGSTNSFGAGDYDLVLVKYDSAGVQQWNRTWGGTGGDYGYGVAVDAVDFVYITGQTDSFGGGDTDMTLVRYTSNGALQWNYTWGGPSSDKSFAVVTDSSYNVYITGRSYSYGIAGGAIVKFNNLGQQLWNRTLADLGCTNGEELTVDQLNNVYISGRTPGYEMGERNAILMKLDSSGVILWNRTWGFSGNQRFEGVAIDSLGYVYCAAYTSGFLSMLLLKYDSSGTPQWPPHWYFLRYWGGEGGDHSSDVAVDSLDNVYLTGYTNSFGEGSNDLALVKFSSIPEITINNPNEVNFLFGREAPNFNISIVGANLDARWYTINNSSTRIPFSGLTGKIDQTEWDKITSSAEYIIEFYVNNTQGKEGYAYDYLYKDLDAPEITIYQPLDGEEFFASNHAPNYDVSIEEFTTIESAWYTFDGINNFTFQVDAFHDANGMLNQGAWDDVPYGDVTITFFAEDFVGNIGHNEVLVKKIRQEPEIHGFYLIPFVSVIVILTVIIIKKKKLIKKFFFFLRES